MKIGIKYCGGCNTNYDRTALVEQLKSKYSYYEFEPAEVGIEYDVLLIVSGCKRLCANYDLLTGKRIIIIDSENEIIL